MLLAANVVLLKTLKNSKESFHRGCAAKPIIFLISEEEEESDIM